MLLSSIIFLPLLAALGLTLVPGNLRVVMRVVALAVSFVTLLLAGALFLQFAPAGTGFQFQATADWLPALGINYHVGVDGLNVALVLMAAIVGFAAVCCSWEIQTNEKLYYILLLTIIGGILGAFASLDLFLFYFFNELALIPTFIMIGVWGRGAQKNYAAYQITLYLSLGALIALAGLIALYIQSGAETLNIVKLREHLAANPLSAGSQKLIFPLLLFGFGVLVGLAPFHSWAPLGYGSAPTATAMMHAGVLKKAGLYAIIRVAMPLMPQGVAEWMPILAWLCLGNILYCGWVAMRQKQLDLLLGYSSLAHMGFVFLGIASVSLIGITGAVVIMVAHGLLAALGFALNGYLYQQTGTLELAKLGGLMRKMPFIGATLVLCFMAGCGLPGFGNFVGEAMVMFGAWKGMSWFVVAAAWGGLIIAAIYMLRAIRSVMHGPEREAFAGVKDANLWRKLPFALLVVALLIVGCFPRVITDRVKPAAALIVEAAGKKDSARAAVLQNVESLAGKKPVLLDAPAGQSGF